MQPQDRPDTSSLCWSTPIDIHLNTGRHRIFKGPCDALGYLVHEWHADHDEPYETAKRSCLDALHHTRDAEEARRAFLLVITEDDASPH